MSFSCSPEAADPKKKLFREIFKNTVWSVNKDLVKFSTEKLFYSKIDGECLFWDQGSFDNVGYDNCNYKNVTYDILFEDDKNFVVREITIGGRPSDRYCGSEETILEFHALSENSMEFSVTFTPEYARNSNIETKRNPDSYVMIKVYNSFEINNCVNGILNNVGRG